MTLDDLLDEFFDAVAENPSGSPRAEAARQALASAFELAVDPSRSTPKSTSVADLLAQLERLKAEQPFTAKDVEVLRELAPYFASSGPLGYDAEVKLNRMADRIEAALRRLSQQGDTQE